MYSPEKIYLVGLLLLLLAAAYLLRRNISYLFCPLQKYAGRIGKGKSTKIGMVHVFISLVPSMFLFGWLDGFGNLQSYFELTFVRILVFLCIWILFFLIIGVCLEQYLLATDPEFRAWKRQRWPAKPEKTPQN